LTERTTSIATLSSATNLKLATSAVTIVIGHYTQKRESGASTASRARRPCPMISLVMLGLMLFLFVCVMPIPNALADPKNRFAWAYALRDLSFAGGAWALAGLHSRASSPQQSKWMILLGRIVIAIAAIFFAVEFFLHPEFAPRPAFLWKRSRHRRFHSPAYGDTSQERSYWPLESAWP
jgi:peptidoglycan/LPS O-acetylase OafA/YrhL